MTNFKIIASGLDQELIILKQELSGLFFRGRSSADSKGLVTKLAAISLPKRRHLFSSLHRNLAFLRSELAPPRGPSESRHQHALWIALKNFSNRPEVCWGIIMKKMKILGLIQDPNQLVRMVIYEELDNNPQYSSNVIQVPPRYLGFEALNQHFIAGDPNSWSLGSELEGRPSLAVTIAGFLQLLESQPQSFLKPLNNQGLGPLFPEEGSLVLPSDFEKGSFRIEYTRLEDDQLVLQLSYNSSPALGSIRYELGITDSSGNHITNRQELAALVAAFRMKDYPFR